MTTKKYWKSMSSLISYAKEQGVSSRKILTLQDGTTKNGIPTKEIMCCYTHNGTFNYSKKSSTDIKKMCLLYGRYIRETER